MRAKFTSSCPVLKECHQHGFRGSNICYKSLKEFRGSAAQSQPLWKPNPNNGVESFVSISFRPLSVLNFVMLLKEISKKKTTLDHTNDFYTSKQRYSERRTPLLKKVSKQINTCPCLYLINYNSDDVEKIKKIIQTSTNYEIFHCGVRNPNS